jgi:sugar phosphate isomerase/epimerase
VPRSLGVVDVVFAPATVPEAARRARELGFDHIDISTEWEPEWDGELALPVGDRIAHPSPRPHCSVAAPPAGDGMWERAVDAYRRTPGVRMEPWPGSVVGSVAAVKAMLDAVPGLRLVVDTGHVACWGEDPVDLLLWADHVQLRQAAKGVAQALEGDVDFAVLFHRLDALDYRGLLSVEYFDLPQFGWPLDDPVGHAVALAAQLRPLLGVLGQDIGD